MSAKGAGAKAGEETIQLYTVNGRKPSARVPLKRYEAMRTAVLKALHQRSDGLSLTELTHSAALHLPKWWSDEKWDEMWHTVSVKLHLEYLGELERVPGTSPHKVRIVAGAASKSSSSGAAKGAAAGRSAKAATAKTAAERLDEDEAISRAPRSGRSAASPKEMAEAMARNLPLRTGRSLAEWIQTIRSAGLKDWREAEVWLKKEHGLSTMYAYMVAGAAFNTGRADYGDSEALLTALYSGEREKLRPVYEKLRELGLKLGKDVQEVVCKTYTSLRGRSQFAVLQPTTRTLLDLALALPPDTQAAGRLEECRPMGGGERNRHRIRLSSVKDIDAEVKGWLKKAYEWDRQR
ncbi:DUF4287 domain-containing protein [bacterium]|nr:DUF4287 domain-containing protein [bacterium]